MKRTLAMASAAVLLLTSLVGCGSSAYDNPEKYLTLPDLSTITISQADIDADLKEAIDSLLDENRKPDYKEQSKDTLAKKGDQVNINYEGKPTDKSLTLSESTIAGMKAEKADLVLGSNSFIGAYTKDGKETHKGFEDQLIGKKAGDKVDVKVKFPDNYQTAELKGVEVVFTVTVNSVSRLSVDKNTLIGVGYSFELKEETPSTEAPATTAPSTEAPATTAPATGDSAASAAPSTEAPATTAPSTEEPATTAPSTKEPSLNTGDSSTTTTAFGTLFKSGTFNIDYLKDADETKFNDIFKIADFRDTFIGKNLYEEVKKEYTIPSDVAAKYKDYAGKTVIITFTVNSATILPEYNDELIKTATSETYTTVKAYEEAMVKSIKIELALVAVEAAAKYSGYPKDEAEKLYEQYVDQLVSDKLYEAIGKTLDEATATELKSAISEATYSEIYATAATQAISSVKSRLLIEYLCNILNVELTDKEYEQKLNETFQQYQSDYYTQYYYSYYYGITFADADDLEAYMGEESLRLQYKSDKMSEELIKVIKVTK